MAVPKPYYCKICGGYMNTIMCESDSPAPTSYSHVYIPDCLEEFGKRLTKMEDVLARVSTRMEWKT